MASNVDNDANFEQIWSQLGEHLPVGRGREEERGGVFHPQDPSSARFKIINEPARKINGFKNWPIGQKELSVGRGIGRGRGRMVSPEKELFGGGKVDHSKIIQESLRKTFGDHRKLLSGQEAESNRRLQKKLEEQSIERRRRKAAGQFENVEDDNVFDVKQENWPSLSKDVPKDTKTGPDSESSDYDTAASSQDSEAPPSSLYSSLASIADTLVRNKVGEVTIDEDGASYNPLEADYLPAVAEPRPRGRGRGRVRGRGRGRRVDVAVALAESFKLTGRPG